MNRLRNHLHVLLIVPLVVIAMTWPVFARSFERDDDLWFHTAHGDFWLEIWDAWHLERVLSGRAELFYSEDIFHPSGVSLAWQSSSYPHAALLMLLRKLAPIDSAYNLAFLATLCLNGFGGYILIRHLVGDKWIALFGALVVCLSAPFPGFSTLPDYNTIWTIPLTIYFFLRHGREKRWIFAALAGFCAGLTAFNSVYIYFINLMTCGIIALFLAASRWRQREFWRGLLLAIAVCAAISWFRFYPMIADAALFKEGVETHLGQARSNDALECCVFIDNPITTVLARMTGLRAPDASSVGLQFGHNEAFLGYINLFFVFCAFLHKPLRRKLGPWLAVLLYFSILRLGHFLTLNGVEYRGVLLPEHFLSEWLPALFGSFYIQEYYQFGVLLPLAVLASYGLARLINAKPARTRLSIVLVSGLILCVEYYDPLPNYTLEREKTAFNDWLSGEPDSAIKLINLPQGIRRAQYYMGLQTLNGYPIVNGRMNRNPISAQSYIRSNALLSDWRDRRSPHCLAYNERDYLRALERLLADGFTHVVVHNWLYGDQYINHSFHGIAPAYDDGLVSVYRLRDLRRSCNNAFTIDSSSPSPNLSILATTSWLAPGERSSILSFHPDEGIDEEHFAYYESLTADWASFIHLYFQAGEPAIQIAGMNHQDMESFARYNQVIYVVYTGGGDRSLPHSFVSLDDFALCQTESYEDGAAIDVYVGKGFSCALIDPSGRLRVEYDNGFAFENILAEMNQDFLDVQLMWSRLPSEPHSFSLQIFDQAGVKVLGQDATIGYDSLARQRVDISSLPPGSYAVKLIVYNFDTGKSVSGKPSQTGLRFERQLQIATIDRS